MKNSKYFNLILVYTLALIIEGSVNLYANQQSDGSQLFTPNSEENFIVTTVYKKGNQTKSVFYNPSDASKAITYFNGLGQKTQTQQLAQTPGKKDLIQQVYYDDFHRLYKSLLPYAKQGQNGAFNSDVSSEQANFYSTDSNHAQSDFPYAITLYEVSPLSRVIEQGAPGKYWQPMEETNLVAKESETLDEGNSNDTIIDDFYWVGYNPDDMSNPTIENDYTGTTGTKSITNYTDPTEPADDETTSTTSTETRSNLDAGNTIAKSYGFNTYEIMGYAPGTLEVTSSADENRVSNPNSSVVYTYTNSLGQVVMKKVVSNGETFITSYLYYTNGLLRKVIPPGPNADDFVYYYDNLNRLIKKEYGTNKTTYFVYDNKDRLVLSTDSKMKSEEKWIFYKYDKFNRAVLSGIFVTSKTHEELQLELKNNEANHERLNGYYEGDFHGYTNDAYPDVDLSVNGNQLLTINYYDNYDFNNYQYDNMSLEDYINQGSEEGYPDDFIEYPQGQMTGSKTRVLGTDMFLLNVVKYDSKYRVIRSYNEYYPDGDELVISNYNFSGQLTKTKTIHNRSTLQQPVEIIQEFDYDHAGRMLREYHKIDSRPKVLLVENVYNELGELISQNIQKNEEEETALQRINYEYNIRGWLKKKNSSDEVNTTNKLFGMELFYVENPVDGMTGFDAQYNGNIAAMRWKNGNNTNQTNLYTFSYCEKDQIQEALYAYKKGPNDWNWTDGAYDVPLITYDKRGNIRSLQRKDSEGNVLDNLTYQYDHNKLLSVDDAGNKTEGFIDDTTQTSEYVYDLNGNMTEDRNKDIIVDYNYLNLPEEIQLELGTIQYIYGAGGAKMAKLTNNGTTTGEKFYMGAFEYEDNELKQIHTSNGRVRYDVNTNDYHYDYYLRDHLGNTRVVFTEKRTGNAAEVLQVNNYYPFGMRFNQGPEYQSQDNQYLYNGKELQSDFDLNWYDYGARFYDAALGRWHVIDPMAEKYIDVSPYNYVLNNPSNAVDPDGKLVIFVNGWTGHGQNHRPFPPKIEFGNNGPLFNGKRLDDFGPNSQGYDYWGKLDNAFMDLFKDRNAVYAYGGNYDMSTAKMRYERGRLAAIYFHDEVIGGNITLQENETIKIVGHSHGAAYAAGLAKELMRRGYSIEYVYYVAAHQPTEFKHPSGTEGVQLIRESDWVSSDQKWFMKGISRSKFGKIEGVDAESFYSLPDMKEGRGGHSAWTYVEWLCKQVKANGGTVTVNGEEQ